MPDVVSFASTGVTYKQGTAVAYANNLGNTSKIVAKVLASKTNIVVAQSGILDTRNDDRNFYTT